MKNTARWPPRAEGMLISAMCNQWPSERFPYEDCNVKFDSQGWQTHHLRFGKTDIQMKKRDHP